MLYSPYVNELVEKEEFEGAFLLKQILLHMDKNGKPYVLMILMDKTGEVEARAWDNANKLYDQLKPQDIVRIAGKVNFYQGRKQVIIQAAEKASESTYPVERFLASSIYDPNKMHADLLTLINTMEDSFIKKLAQNIVTDSELKPKILRAPAAKSVHHAYAGGLIEHVLSVCRILDFLSIHYKNYYGKAVNRDILLIGGILHDIGKIFELRFDRGTEYTDEGRLIGHLVMGTELVDKFAAQIPNFPDKTRLLIKHQILAHHGKLEYGSPKLPVTIEALIVHYIDDLDSKVNSILGLMEKDGLPGNWTSTLKMYERNFWKADCDPKMQGTSPGI